MFGTNHYYHLKLILFSIKCTENLIFCIYQILEFKYILKKEKNNINY